MKKNRIGKSANGSAKWKIAAAAVVLAALSVGAWYLCSKMHAAFLAQCVVTDVGRQVKVTTGQMLKEGTVLELFKLRKGANLAEIDFAGLREKALKRYPAIRAIYVARHLPDKVEIKIEERIPVVRLNEIDARRMVRKSPTGRVADAEGIVFTKSSGTEALPVIYERAGDATKPGRTLPPRAMAALRLLALAREQPYCDLGIMRVDTDSRDYLLAILGDYSPAKIAWEGMETDTDASQKAMARQLRHLRDSVASRVAPAGTRPIVWNATEPDRVFADTKEPIL